MDYAICVLGGVFIGFGICAIHHDHLCRRMIHEFRHRWAESCKATGR